MPQLRVWKQLTVSEQGCTDTRTEGQHDYRTADSPAGTPFDLGDARSIRIVEEDDRTLKDFRGERGTVHTDPAAVDVRRGAHLALFDDTRERDTNTPNRS